MQAIFAHSSARRAKGGSQSGHVGLEQGRDEMIILDTRWPRAMEKKEVHARKHVDPCRGRASAEVTLIFCVNVNTDACIRAIKSNSSSLDRLQAGR